MFSSSLAALSLRACSSLRYASTTTAAAAAAAGNAAATTTTTKRRRRSRADVVDDDVASADSTSTSFSSSDSSSSPDAWRASLPDDARATALAAALRRSLTVSGTKPESALAFVAERVKTGEDARAAFDAAAALRAARVERGQRGELRPKAHAALASAAVRAAAAEISAEGAAQSSEESISKLLASTLGRARQAGMPVGAGTFSDAAWALMKAVKASSSGEEEETSASSNKSLLASAVRGVLAASLGCRVAPTPEARGGAAQRLGRGRRRRGRGRGREELAAEFEANGVRLSPFAVKALERARSGVAAAAAAAESPAAPAEAAAEEVEEGLKAE